MAGSVIWRNIRSRNDSSLKGTIRMLTKMKMLSGLLAIILLAGMVFACGNPGQTPGPSGPPEVPADRVELVMFHRTVR